MGKYRKRFNEKARAGMLAKQAALKSARQKQFTRHLDDGTTEAEPVQLEQDPNAELLQPMKAAEKEERKRKLKETLYASNEESKMSRAKRKRLDKYIEHQIKREEKKVLLEKLAETKMDTSLLAPSKLLGSGKQTRREEMIEALDLERQGRADERTRAILYEEREVKDWDDDFDESDMEAKAEPITPEELAQKLSFVDFRPKSQGGAGSTFAFSDLPKVEKSGKKKYTWRVKLQQEAQKKAKAEDDNDFVLSDEELSEAEVRAAEEALANGEDLSQSDSDSELTGDDKDDKSEESSDESSDQELDEDEPTSAKRTDMEPQDTVDLEEEDDDEDNDEEDEDDDEDDDEDEDEESELESEPRLLQNKPKHSDVAASFKEWAEEQVRQMEGRNEMVLPELAESTKERYAAGLHHDEAFSEEEGAVRVDTTLKREAFFVDVTRPDDVQKLRIQLPVFAEEHRIMEAIHHHDCVVLCGETGSGKTTQVPQFLYEAGFGNLKSDLYPGMIGITQPRRVAAVAMANRVLNELGDVHGKRVGYQIRFDTTIKNEGQEDGTAMKFMTDGVLLREMMTDFLLTKYSALIIDEAHERNVNTDILIGMLSRVVKLRRQKSKPLKLIIMSATLRVADFSENKQLFPTPPPVLKVDARQYPVSVHFDKKTKFDYLDEAFKKTCKIHKRLPPGGILIFLTGQNEINGLVKRLRAEFPVKGQHKNSKEPEIKYQLSKNVDMEAEDVDLDIALRERRAVEAESSSDDSDSDEEEGFEETLEAHQTENDPLHVLPLYSLLPTAQQMKVFDEPPAGSRLCIVATNVAETSLTIPGIRYVVDCGRSKERKFDEDTGVQSFEVDWVSKASADQRSGRAGRTGPGHCYRLFSSAVYEDFFDQFSKPEILRMPVESTCLTMKSMGIDQIVNFPFPTPPDRRALFNAEKLLITLGALDKAKKQITELGRTMARFPLSPRYAKILVVGNQLSCLPYVIAIVCGLSVGDPFLGEQDAGVNDPEDSDTDDEHQGEIEERRKMRTKFFKSRAIFSRLDPHSDVFKLLSAVCAMDHVPKGKSAKFVKDNFLRPKLMEEIQKLRKQIDHIVSTNLTLDVVIEQPGNTKKLGVPTAQQIAAMKQIVASGFIDQVAIRSDAIDADVKIPKKTTATAVPYTTITSVSRYGDNIEPYVYIHPGSVMAGSGAAPPQYLVFQSLNKGANQQEGRPIKLRMKPLLDLSGKQLHNVAKTSLLITYSKPLGHPYGPKDLSPTKRECYVVPRYGAALGDGGLGWDLPVVKVTQTKQYGLWTTDV